MSKERQSLPAKIGDIIELSVDSLTASGEGVGRYQGFIFFVPEAVPGDEVKARVISVKPSYARALLVEVIKPSAQRFSPPCPVYAECGACQLQHVGYEQQLRHKKQFVVDALERIGKLDNPPVRPVLPMTEPWRYRNKAQFPVASMGGEIIAGCYRQRSHEVIDVADCLIQHELNNRVLSSVKELANAYRLSTYNEQTGSGFLRHVLVRVGFQTGQVLLVLVTSQEGFPQGAAFARSLMADNPELVGVVQNVNPKRTNVVLGEKMVTLAGRDYLIEELGGLKFKISARSFFQVNPIQTKALYDTVLHQANLTGVETVIDAYCGIGSISLYLARQAREVIGVEVVSPAVADAKTNARLNEIDNVRFLVGQAEKVIPYLYEKGTSAAVVVVDPPRAGCDQKLLETIVAMAPERLVYVSCNPATLARDLKYLVEKGFSLQEVQPVDMFPHTGHVESCSLLVKDSSEPIKR